MRTRVRKRTEPRFRRKPYYAVKDWGIVAGQRVTEERAFRTRADALDWLDGEVAAGASVAPAGSVGALLHDWYEWGTTLRLPPWSPSHAKRVRGIIERDLAPLHRVPAHELDVAGIERLLARRAREGAGESAREHIRNAISGAYTHARRTKVYRGLNPARDVDKQRDDERRLPEFLRPDDARRFIAAVREHWYGPFWILSMSVAFRPGEGIGLEWSDLEGDVLHVRRNVQLVDGERHIRIPKRGSFRDVVLAEPLLALLDHQRRRQRERREALLRRGRAWVNPRLMFTNRFGDYISADNVNRRLRKALEDSGLPRITEYNLRHTGATMMLAQGVSERNISDTLGHRSAQTTRRYARVLDEQRREVAQRVGAWLTGPDPGQLAGKHAGKDEGAAIG